MKPKKRSIGDVGIRLKPNEPNILVNYMKYRKRVQKTKKKKPKRKPTRSTKSVEIKDKKDPFLKIVEDSQDKRDDLIVKELDDSSETNLEESVKPTETRTIHVDTKPRELSETDPNVKKTVKITASLKPDKKKEGGGIILE
jgi:hypothetical protein